MQRETINLIFHFLTVMCGDGFNGLMLPIDLRGFNDGDPAADKLLIFIVAVLFRLAAIDELTVKRDLFNPLGLRLTQR